MPDLTGQEISNSYKRLMQVKTSANEGITTTLRTIQSGDNADSPLQLNNSTLNVNGTFAIGGVNLTATVSSLNAIVDITGGAGYVVVSGTDVYKRSFSAGNGINITNNDGTEGNTGIALTSTISNIQDFGASAVSANTLNVTGTMTVSTMSVTDFNAATVSATSLLANNATIVSTVSAAFFVGDGSGLVNVPSAEGGTVNAVVAGTGLNATVNGVTSTTVNTSGTLNVNPNQSFGTVSVSTGLVVPQGAATFSVPISGTSAVFTGDVSAANVFAGTNVYVGGTAVATQTNVAAVSALTKTNLDSITSINTVVANVSALTSVNKADIIVNVSAIASINAIIGDGGNYATSAELATVSAALATSIGNSNTNIAAVSVLTSVNKADIATNVAAITSINTVVDNLDFATSAELATVSSALATSIGNSNTNIAAVSVLTSVNKADIATNVAAITSINTVVDGLDFATSAELATVSSALATSIANHLPLAGGTITGTVSAQSVYVSALGANTSATLGKRIRMDGAAVADIVSLTDGTSIAINFNDGQNFAVQLTDNRTLENPTNCVPGQTGSIFVIQDGTGSRTLSFGANYKFPGGTAPTLSTGASACDRIDYITFTSSNVHAVATLNVSTA
tara:strand:+ start:294 stop:2171 length:1878 start_codon:yes stop_codon:yes gene_type:complete